MKGYRRNLMMKAKLLLGLRARIPPKISVYKHTHARTHTHLYRYWPGVQDMPAKEAESKMYFLLQKNPN